VKRQESLSLTDGAFLYIADGTTEDLEAGGNGDGFVPNILRQTPNTPDININDLDSFALVKVDVK
jgi:hypothetical protein